MNLMRIIAFLLLAAGTFALAYGGFSYTEDNTAVKLGSVELSVAEKHTINVPVWAGIGAVAIGALLLLVSGRKR